MVKGFTIVAMIYLAGVLDTTIAPSLAVYGVSPDFLALAATLATFMIRGAGGFVLAGVAGVVNDLNAPGRLGVGMAVFTAVAFILCVARRSTWRRPLVQTALTIPAVAAMSLGIVLLRCVFKETEWSLAAFVVGSVGVGLYTAFAAFPCYCLIDCFARRHATAF